MKMSPRLLGLSIRGTALRVTRNPAAGQWRRGSGPGVAFFGRPREATCIIWFGQSNSDGVGMRSKRYDIAPLSRCMRHVEDSGV